MKSFLLRIILTSILLLPGIGAEPSRPNILWITVEDMSPTLGCYGDAYAGTPHLDRFAAQSVRFTHAFAVSPVCSPSRSCLITGVHPVTSGTHPMRSAFPLPSEVTGFPAFLRKAGYFCSNNVKTDYNTADEARLIAESWNARSSQAHWRDAARASDQPFFAVFNDMVTHQSRSMVWPYATFQKHVQSQLDPDRIHDPEKAPLPAYYPDTPMVRRAVARYYDCVSVMDQNVGRLLAQLEEDGLAENTIVFFFSDHGSGMPRHKRNLHDSGMRVPLMIRFPVKYRHLAPAAPGETVDRLVSFVDFPATVLELAGVPKPGYMEGLPFAGENAEEERTFVYGSRDRVDEAYDTARSLRDRRYLYIRNYQPQLSYHQPSAFPDLGAIRQEITQVARNRSETLTRAQRAYVSPTRPVEEFYDCQSDPENVDNLALPHARRTPAQSAALERMRASLVEERRRHRDAGALTETEAWGRVRTVGMPLATLLKNAEHSSDLEKAWAVAERIGDGSSTSEDFLALLESGTESERFWAAIGLHHLAADDSMIKGEAAALLEDSLKAFPSARLATAAWLARDDACLPSALSALTAGLDDADWWTALQACRHIELLGRRASSARDAMRAVYERTRHGEGDANLFLAFSSGAFLDDLGEPVEPWDFSPEASE